MKRFTLNCITIKTIPSQPKRYTLGGTSTFNRTNCLLKDVSLGFLLRLLNCTEHSVLNSVNGIDGLSLQCQGQLR